RFRLSAPVQAVFFLVLMALVGWSGYAAARLVSGDAPAIAPAVPTFDTAAASVRRLEQRQQLIEQMLAGVEVDAAVLAAAAEGAPVAQGGPLERVEKAQ